MMATERIHTLKCWPDFFQAVYDQRKTFEYRLNDRDYRAGDRLRLREYDPAREDYTLREVWCFVRYVCYNAPGMPEGYCIMSIGAPLE